jgi:hypothetical protein
MPRPLYHLEKTWVLGGTQSGSGFFWRKKSPLLLTGLKTLDRPVRRHVTVRITLSRPFLRDSSFRRNIFFGRGGKLLEEFVTSFSNFLFNVEISELFFFCPRTYKNIQWFQVSESSFVGRTAGFVLFAVPSDGFLWCSCCCTTVLAFGHPHSE